MKVSLNWLKERLDLSLPPEELSVKLAALGFEVAALEKKGAQFRGVVTAKVLTVDKHPNADRLRLCTVDDGSQKFSVVCGAPNVAAGQTVALARIGAELPGGKKLGAAKIRGVDSQGMLCSTTELGLPGDANGIMVLGEGTPLGQDFAAMQGPGDAVMEVEITPNRPDCLSHLGLARELSAYLGLPLKEVPAGAFSADAALSCPGIMIEDTAACPVYIGRLITGAKVGPSPAWLKAKLEAVGLRPINNVVDATNYILMDMGQPMHAFDVRKLSGPEIRVRMAKAGEKIVALDGKTYDVDGCLVIADAAKPVAIAGVMGGQLSGVVDDSTTILLESAYFKPAVVRKSGQKLRLKSDSSYRFERGVDPGAVEAASARAAALIAELTGGKVSPARVAGALPAARHPIEFSAARVNEILGSSFAPHDVDERLRRIAAKVEHGRFYPPSHRGDLETVWDLAEEAARLLGYDSVPSVAAPVAPRPAKLTPYEALAEKARARLAALGLFEACNYDFVSEKALTRAGLSAEFCARLANALSDDWTLLRPTLLVGLLQNAAANLNHGAASVRLFELGSVYRRFKEGLAEKRRAAALILGPVADPHWQAARIPAAGFYDIKGLAEELLAGVPGVSYAPLREAKTKTEDDSLFHPAAALRIDANKRALGTVGLLHPTLAREWGLDRQPVGLLDIDLDALLRVETKEVRYAPYSLFPVSRRDLSLLVDTSVPYAALEKAAREGAGAALLSVELADVFAGKGLPPGKHSLLLRLTFGLMERTLTDAEVNASVDGALGALKRSGAELRQ